MSKCKDCLHYESCSTFRKIITSAVDVETRCEHFKNRKDFVEVVHGCWVKRQDICEALELEEAYSCSECGKSSIVKHNFCNRCGAKMDGGSDG